MSLTNEQKRAFANREHLNWGAEMERHNAEMAVKESARRAALSPNQRAAENAAKAARNSALAAERAALAAQRAPAIPVAAPRVAVVRRPAPVVGYKPPHGKSMRECRVSNVRHTHASGENCKFVHKNENAYAHLRPEQKRPAGGKATRKAGRKAGGGNIKIVASPAPLSKVDTYTSWPGGIDPTVPLYNQRTMLGGKRSTKRR